MLYKIFNVLIIVLLFFSFSIAAKVQKITNFNQAKAAAVKINHDAPGTFYCGCPIQWKGKKGKPDLISCGYRVRKNEFRANRIEWEHVVSAWEFAHQRQCWKKGGRKECAKDVMYRKIETDLHNLQPVIGEINGDCGNYQYGQWHNSEDHYGSCKIKIDFKKKKVEPPDRARGAIARTYFYMRDRYNLSLSQSQTQLFELWNLVYPVTEWECKRNQRINSIQGNTNPYILQGCKQ